MKDKITVSEKMTEPQVWFDKNFEIINDFLTPVFDKHWKDAELILNESNQMIFNNNPKSTDFPHLYSFCRDGVHAFQKMWDYFKKDEREYLYNAYHFRVVESGFYTSTMTLLIECNVIYPILTLLTNTADGSQINFWIYETVLTPEEWDSLIAN